MGCACPASDHRPSAVARFVVPPAPAVHVLGSNVQLLSACRTKRSGRGHPRAAAALRCLRCRSAFPRLPCPSTALQRIIIYPNYLDSRKTVAMGRRIPKELGEQQTAAAGSSSSTRRPKWRATALRLPLTAQRWPPAMRAFPAAAACEAPNAIEIAECITNGLKLEAEPEVRRQAWRPGQQAAADESREQRNKNRAARAGCPCPAYSSPCPPFCYFRCRPTPLTHPPCR